MNDAVAHAEAAVLAEPHNPAYRTTLGAAYMEAGRFLSAKTSFDDALTPAVRPVDIAPVAAPAVLREREKIAERIAPTPRTKARIERNNRAAFTLRLDTDRHLKLRLACTARDCSAQALVTEALDALLGEMPELDALAAQLKRR